MSDQSFNRLKTLRTLRRLGAVSRVELAQRTGLTKATITALADELIGKGLLVEDPPLQSARGRPRINLRIRQDAAYAISLFPLMDDTASVDIVDLHGTRLHTHVGAMPRLAPNDALPGIIADLVGKCLDGAPSLRPAVRVAAIVIPGQIDQRGGVVHWLPKFGEQRPLPPPSPLPLKALLEPMIGLPVVVENRATVIARAEHWFGPVEHSDNFSLFAMMEWGMSGARYANGTLKSGFNGMNSEMAHIKIAFENGRSCFCGGTGCLAAYATVAAVFDMLAERKGMEPPQSPVSDEVFSQVVDLARQGDEDAKAVFAVAARALGVAIASHVNEHDPGRVILASSRGRFLDVIEPELRAVYAAEVLPSLKDRTELQTLAITGDLAGRGAAAVAIEEVFLTF
ncbi:MAG: ROK family transcriptional regulator [Novosphingobium sp.]|nr:ROK family transcriptional regulator [Novosphingobium sp.]